MASLSASFLVAVAVFIAMNVVAVRYVRRAHCNLAPDAPSALWVLFIGGFAKRHYFTSVGWEMRRRAIWWNTFSIVPAVVAMFSF